jgi:hypothetical protein
MKRRRKGARRKKHEKGKIQIEKKRRKGES